MSDFLRFIALQNTQGNSNKFYNIAMFKAKTSDNPQRAGYIVHTYWGPIGGQTTEQTKTPTPVTYDEAYRVCSRLASEKKRKGYREVYMERPTTRPRMAMPQQDIKKEETKFKIIPFKGFLIVPVGRGDIKIRTQDGELVSEETSISRAKQRIRDKVALTETLKEKGKVYA